MNYSIIIITCIRPNKRRWCPIVRRVLLQIGSRTVAIASLSPAPGSLHAHSSHSKREDRLVLETWIPHAFRTFPSSSTTIIILVTFTDTTSPLHPLPISHSHSHSKSPTATAPALHTRIHAISYVTTNLEFPVPVPAASHRATTRRFVTLSCLVACELHETFRR